MNQSIIDNMTIDELAHYIKTGFSRDKWFLYAARQLGERYFIHKSKQLIELESELKTIYEKHPELIPHNPL
jgi:hypothetical protein